MIEPINNYILTIEHSDNSRLQLSINGDCDISELKNAFITIMTWMTFMPQTISELFANEE